MPHDVLGKISNRIINEVKGINRVCYDVSSKPPATIECGPQGRFSQFCAQVGVSTVSNSTDSLGITSEGSDLLWRRTRSLLYLLC